MTPRARLLFIVESATDVRLVEGLAKRYELTVLLRKTASGNEISQPWSGSITVLSAGPSRALFALFVLSRLVRNRREVPGVLVQGYGVAALAANLAGRALRLPVTMLVCSPLEEYYAWREASRGTRFRHHELLLLRLVARLNARLGQRYIVLSSYLENAVRRHGGHLPIAICPLYGVDTELFKPSPKPRGDFRAELGLPDEGQVVFFSSRVAPEKDVETLLDAMRLLVERGRDLHLVNTSGGYQELLAKARDHNISDRVLAFPAVDPRTELVSYYHAADLCVQASRSEGLGFSPLEALASGTPVVASSVGGLRETVVDGETGWTYPPGDATALADAIGAVLDNPEEASRRTESGRRLVLAGFEQQQVFEQAQELIATLPDGRPNPAEPRRAGDGD